MKNKTNLIFIHKVLKAIADSLIQVFIPLYILKVSGDINLAFMYLAIHGSMVIIFNIALKKLLQKFGVICIILHFIPIIATEAILSFCQITPLTIIPCALCTSLTQTLYSVPLNLIFSFSDKKTNVAKFQIATNIGKLVFILVGGFFLSSSVENSFLILSVVSSFIYVLSVIPIFYAYDMLKTSYNSHPTSTVPRTSTDKWFAVFHMSFGTFQETIDKIVPLFLFINNLSFQAVTTLLAVNELIKVGTNYFAKYLVKSGKEKLSCLLSCVVLLCSVVGILFVKNSTILYILSCLCSFSFPLTFVPMFKKYCNHLTSTNRQFEGMTERDIEIFSCRPIMHSSCLIFSSFYGPFAIGMISIISLFIAEMKLTK